MCAKTVWTVRFDPNKITRSRQDYHTRYIHIVSGDSWSSQIIKQLNYAFYNNVKYILYQTMHFVSNRVGVCVEIVL